MDLGRNSARPLNKRHLAYSFEIKLDNCDTSSLALHTKELTRRTAGGRNGAEKTALYNNRQKIGFRGIPHTVHYIWEHKFPAQMSRKMLPELVYSSSRFQYTKYCACDRP